MRIDTPTPGDGLGESQGPAEMKQGPPAPSPSLGQARGGRRVKKKSFLICNYNFP